MKGVILDEGFEYYTYMNVVLTPIKDDFKKYNWLITDYDCSHYPDPRIQYVENHAWISGEDFLGIVERHEIQFIWAVFSAIPKQVPLEEVLKYDLPQADGYRGFWENPITIQHPLAEMEIVPWDSGLVLLIAKEDDCVTRFAKHFPLSRDLAQYNAQRRPS